MTGAVVQDVGRGSACCSGPRVRTAAVWVAFLLLGMSLDSMWNEGRAFVTYLSAVDRTGNSPNPVPASTGAASPGLPRELQG